MLKWQTWSVSSSCNKLRSDLINSYLFTEVCKTVWLWNHCNRVFPSSVHRRFCMFVTKSGKPDRHALHYKIQHSGLKCLTTFISDKEECPVSVLEDMLNTWQKVAVKSIVIWCHGEYWWQWLLMPPTHTAKIIKESTLLMILGLENNPSDLLCHF